MSIISPSMNSPTSPDGLPRDSADIPRSPSLQLAVPPLLAVSTQTEGTPLAPRLSEVISSFENCKSALARASQVMASIVTSLKQQPGQLLEDTATVKEEDRDEFKDEANSLVKTEPDSDVEIACIMPKQPTPSAGTLLLLDRKRQRSASASVVYIPIGGRQSIDQQIEQVPEQTKRSKYSQTRTEGRKRRKIRSNARKRARWEAELSKVQKRIRAGAAREEVEYLNTLRVPRPPSLDPSKFGTKANREPLPFNRLNTPRPTIESTVVLPQVQEKYQFGGQPEGPTREPFSFKPHNAPHAAVESAVVLPQVQEGYQFGGRPEGLYREPFLFNRFNTHRPTVESTVVLPQVQEGYHFGCRPEGPTVSTSGQRSFFFHSARVMNGDVARLEREGSQRVTSYFKQDGYCTTPQALSEKPPPVKREGQNPVPRMRGDDVSDFAKDNRITYLGGFQVQHQAMTRL